MYAIENVCSTCWEQLISLVAEFAWDAEILRVAFSANHMLIDFGNPLEAEALTRLAEKSGHEVSHVDRNDISPDQQWILLRPYSPEED